MRDKKETVEFITRAGGAGALYEKEMKTGQERVRADTGPARFSMTVLPLLFWVVTAVTST